MKVIIQTINGHSYSLEISGENLILDLKTNYKCIQFKFCGNVLRDDKTLNSYGIEDEDIIISEDRANGGGPA